MAIGQHPTRSLECAAALAMAIGIANSAHARPQPAGHIELQPRTIRHSAGVYQAEIGHLSVLENRSQPGSRTIEIAVGRIKSTSDKPGAPIVYLAGGPGSSATAMASSPQWAELLEIADVILVDQRGIGRSRPALSWAPEGLDPSPIFLSAESALETEKEAARLAREHFEREGVDLSGYNTAENAADFDDLRQALGCDKMSLMGHSYGTHLAQEIVRRFPGSVDRVILIGTAGMNDMYALPAELDDRFARLSALVAADPSIGGQIPDLIALFNRVRARLRDAPARVAVSHPQTKAPVDILVGEAGIRFIILRDMGDVSDIPVLPRLLFDIDRGDTRLLGWFVQKRYEQMRTVPTLTWVMRGASSATAERWAMIERQAPASLFGKARCWPPRELFPILGIPDLGDEFRAPVRSDVPALFISGALDANTPPEQAEAVRTGFSNSGHLIVENGGHEDLTLHEPVRSAMMSFLRTGKAKSERVRALSLRFVPLDGDVSWFEHPALNSLR